MSANFSSIFKNKEHAEGVCSLRVTGGAGRHCSMLDHNQGRAARRAAANWEVTPFNFNISQYQVCTSSDTPFCSCETDL